MDSGFRRNDVHLDLLVIPAKAGIQTTRLYTVLPDLLRSYNKTRQPANNNKEKTECFT